MLDRELSQKWMPENRDFWELNPAIVDTQGYLFDRPCFYLYRSMAFYPGGGVSPCCFTHDKSHDFAAFTSDGLAAVWTVDRYVCEISPPASSARQWKPNSGATFLMLVPRSAVK